MLPATDYSLLGFRGFSNITIHCVGNINVVSSMPYLRLIRIPPSPSVCVPSLSKEHHQIRSTLSQVHRDLAQLDDARAQLKVIQDSLLHKQEALRAFSKEHSVLLSPVQCLPLGILAEIFLYFTPSAQHKDTPQLMQSVMLPSHICQQWHRVALPTSQLWSHIIVDVNCDVIKTKFDCAEAWLAHTGRCQLSLKITCVFSQFEGAWRSLLDLVLPHCARWRHVDIWVFQPFVGALSMAQNNLSSLESLRLIVLLGDYIFEQIIDVFKVAPKLKHFITAGDILTKI